MRDSHQKEQAIIRSLEFLVPPPHSFGKGERLKIELMIGKAYVVVSIKVLVVRG